MDTKAMQDDFPLRGSIKAWILLRVDRPKKGGGITMRLRHKYNAQRAERDGMKFDSKKEATYYDKLILAQQSGELLFFLRQVPFHLEGNVVVRVDYVEFWADGQVRIVDVKGYRTPAYKRNKKQVEARYPVIIEEE
jgi:dsDNA-binding SOS-regulon protein